jgi:ABC-type multidrug transport system ATPase subunit
VLSVENLGKRFGTRWVFKGLSFSVLPKQRLTILGQNGSGKSTLLKVLAELIPPSEGKVTHEAPEIRTSLGYAALEGTLYPNLTVQEHLEFTAELRGVASRSKELLERVNLAYADDKYAAALSTGMRTRLKLAIALQCSPKLLLLDEPGAGLDEAGRSLVAEILNEQCREGAAIIATNDPLERKEATHELELV